LEGTSFEPASVPPPCEKASMSEPLIRSRRTFAESALGEMGGNKTRAARLLGVTRKTLYAWLREPPKEDEKGGQPVP
jgi:two-component system response regulator HydG